MGDRHSVEERFSGSSDLGVICRNCRPIHPIWDEYAETFRLITSYVTQFVGEDVTESLSASIQVQ